ncbi:MAG TPA: S8 family peptidase [Acidobacteriota bacterium]|nr:S8 family peptidase [Acidobacteriota bacterium]
MRPLKVLRRKENWIACAILFLFLLPIMGQSSQDPLNQFSGKLSPVLKKLLVDQGNKGKDNPIAVIVKFKKGTSDKDKQKPPKAKDVKLVNAYAHWHKGSEIKGLLNNPNIEYITFDPVVRGHQSISTATAVTAARNISLATIGADQANNSGYDGRGMTVAVLDSGIYAQHPDLTGRVIAAVDFTSGQAVQVPYNTDRYGHGTHVAGIIGGNGSLSGGTYAGVAPKVNFVDVKVIGDNGSGRTSDLINAIAWVIQNKNTYNIRAANLSLGHIPVESYTTDPSCQAVEQLVAAGIVTVAASGNMGKNATYSKIWGAIDSPGTDPNVITVYPINTRGTVSHSDDIATSYGSRGFTYLDKLFKPDISAPGNKITSLLSPGSLISTEVPTNIVDSNYITLSGSSMSTPYVTGTIALMLQANPSLTPRMVKMLLCLTATKLDQPHILEQGNGLLNALTAVQMARVTDMPGKRLGQMSPKWSLDGEDVWAGGAVALSNKIAYSKLVNPAVARFWGSGIPWLNAIVQGNSVIWSDGFLSTTSIVWSDGVIWSDSIIWSDTPDPNAPPDPDAPPDLGSIIWSDTVTTDLDAIIWSDTILFADTVIWSDADLEGDLNSIIWSDAILLGDPK